MTKQKPEAFRFAEALGEGVDLAFKNIASEILSDGALSAKEKALIAVACSVAIRCENCIKVNEERALETGASREEILEAGAVAGLVRLGSSFTSAAVLLDDLER